MVVVRTPFSHLSACGDKERMKLVVRMQRRGLIGLLYLLLAAVLVLTPAGEVLAWSGDSPVNTAACAASDGQDFLQFTSAGHVLGFTEDSVIIASASHMLKTEFVNANPTAPEADKNSSGETSDGMAAPLNRVTYKDIWPGVTVVYEASEGAIVKSTYYLDAKKDGIPVDSIRLGYNHPVSLDEQGNLCIVYENGTMVESAPIAWQEIGGERKPVTVSYVLHGEQEVGFSLGDCIPGIPVVIDPALTWNTFLGGSGDDIGIAIAVDGSGNVYVSGQSNATWGSPVRPYTLDEDAFVAKLNSSGNLIWNTFLGGSGYD